MTFELYYCNSCKVLNLESSCSFCKKKELQSSKTVAIRVQWIKQKDKNVIQIKKLIDLEPEDYED